MNTAFLKFKLKMILTFAIVLLITFFVIYGIVIYLGYGINNIYLFYVSIFITLVYVLFQWAIGPNLIHTFNKENEITKDSKYSWILDIVDNIAKKNKIKTPKVYIANVNYLNAYAYGNIFTGPRVAITKGLLNILDKDEIEAVLGHEIGHLRHRDVSLLMAIGIIPTLIYWLGLLLSYNPELNRRGNSMLIGFGLIAFSFIFEFFILYINRQREALEDINSVFTVKKPKSLEMALAKITLANQGVYVNHNSINNMLMFSPLNNKEEINDPNKLIEKWRKEKVSIFEELFMDHPHPANRIKLIESVSR